MPFFPQSSAILGIIWAGIAKIAYVPHFLFIFLYAWVAFQSNQFIIFWINRVNLPFISPIN